MSRLGEIAGTAAKDLAKAGEDAGKAVEEHFTEIGSTLKKGAGLYRNVESDTRDSIEKVATEATHDAERDASTVAKDASSELSQSGKDATKAASEADSDAARLSNADREVEDAQVPGENGASDDPVDLSSGEMFMTQGDLALPAVLPLELERIHRSGYRRGRVFGPTWAGTLDQRIEVDDDGVHYAAPDGVVLHYRVPSAPHERVMPSEGARWPLSYVRKDDLFLIEQPETGRTLHFPRGPIPQLCRPIGALTDRNGNRIQYAYDADGVPTDVYHSGGYHVQVASRHTRGGVRVSGLELVDPAGTGSLRVVEFEYDVAGRLTGVVNSSGIPQLFDYDERDRITAWTDRNGYSYRYHYGSDGRVVRAEGDEGSLNVSFDYDDEWRITTLTDSLGQRTAHHFNERGQVVKVVDPLGGQVLTECDRFNRLIARTDEIGRTTRIIRDEQGDAVRVEYPDGSVMAVAYNAMRQPVEVVEPDGSRWQYAYDDRGNLTGVTDPAGTTTSYAYDERGAAVSMTDGLGAIVRIAADRRGLASSITDQLGAVTSLRRDPFGRVVMFTDPLGGVTTTTWNIEGDPQTCTYPDGSSESWVYDAEGNVLAHTNPAGCTTTFEYGPFNQPVARVGPDGARYGFVYDTELQLTEVTGPAGLTWRYEYDAAKNLVAETDFRGHGLVYRYDPAGQLLERDGGPGRVIAFEYDTFGRLVARRSGEACTSFGYDARGLLAWAQNSAARVEYARDPLGRVLSETVNGQTLTNQYDLLGQRTRRTTPTGVSSQWTYDAAGRPTAFAGAAGALAFDYDAAGREVSRSLGPATLLNQTFDQLGRLTGQAIWTRETPGASAPNTEWRALQTRSYRYRPDGAPEEITDRLRGTRAFELDRAGRVTAITAASWTERYAYDPGGNLAHAEAVAAPGAPFVGNAMFGEQAQTPINRGGRAVYEYDDAGRVVRASRRTLSGKLKAWTYMWDAEDQLVEVASPDGAVWQYAYDPLGRRIAKRRIDGAAAQGEPVSYWFTWDGVSLAEQYVTEDADEFSVTTWDYEPGTYRPAAQTRRSWAAGAPQAEIDVAFHAIVTDVAGTPQELVTPDGRIAWHPTRSLWGTTLAAAGDGTTDCPLRFPGQYHDAETGLDYNVFRYYDAENAAYISADPLGLTPAPNHYAYVENPLVEADPLGLKKGGGSAGKKARTELIERYGSEAEAKAALQANGGTGGLVPRPGHERQPKWIADDGTVDPRTLGKKNNYTHKVTYEMEPGTKDWLKQFEIKENEPNRYAVPADKIDEFNARVKKTTAVCLKSGKALKV